MNQIVIVGTGLVGIGFPEEHPAALLGQRGLQFKDEATKLGMAAAHCALNDAGAADTSETAVVVSSNYGNLDTVCRMVGNADKPAERSPMDLPNASSNVIASSIAIRFGLAGPNLMLCSGPNAGLDALYWAGLLLKARRAVRVLVVGVEVDNPVVRRFAYHRPGAGYFHGAAAVVVEFAGASASVPRSVLGHRACGSSIPTLLTGITIDACYATDFGVPAVASEVITGTQVIDVADRFGVASGALGVVQATLATKAHGTSVLITGGIDTAPSACLVTSTIYYK